MKPAPYIRQFRAPLLIAAWLAIGAGRMVYATDADPFMPQLDALEPLWGSLEESVARGVAWLTAAQQPDGSTAGGYGNNTGVIGLCGMAMLAAGMTPAHPVCGSNIVRYAEYILESQREDGVFWREDADNFGGHAYMYAHAISTAFLEELSGMVGGSLQRKLDAPVAKAIAVIIQSQNGGGGWRYHPQPDREGDLSVSSWNLLALRIARSNGAPVPTAVFERGIAYVNRCRDRGRSMYTYLPAGAGGRAGPWGHTVQMTACGLLCMMLAGQHADPTHPEYAQLILSAARPDGWVTPADFWNMPGRDVYCLYHATQALYQVGGSQWVEYAQRVFPGIINRQQEDGSWNGSVGSAFNTAMHVLCLTAPYEQAPMYQR